MLSLTTSHAFTVLQRSVNSNQLCMCVLIASRALDCFSVLGNLSVLHFTTHHQFIMIVIVRLYAKTKEIERWLMSHISIEY